MKLSSHKEKPLILAVDDEEDLRLSVKSLLEDAGFLVKTANNGNDCLKKIEAVKPDLILLDILMPGLATKEILAGIKKRLPRVPIIFLTVVRFSEATKMNLLQKGTVSEYIEKPFENNDLIKKIKAVLKISPKKAP